MTGEEIQKLKAMIAVNASYYSQIVQDNVLALYVADLADLPLAAVERALHELRRDSRTTRFPLPATIRERILGAKPGEMDHAREASARILAAVSKFGPYNLEGAKEFVGSLGWEVVVLQGGWLEVCEKLDYSNQGQMQAQWRDLAESVAKRRRAGHVAGPSLPSPGSPAIDVKGLLPRLPK